MKKSVVALVLAGLFILSGCGSKGADSYSMSKGDVMTNGMAAAPMQSVEMDYGIYEEAGESYDMEMVDSSTDTTASVRNESVRDGRKLIRTAQLSVETLEFDGMLGFLKDRTTSLGGYVENMEVNNGSRYDYYGTSNMRRERSAYMVLRIPTDRLDEFLGEVAENGNIISRSEQEQDVTTAYVDLESHKKTLLIEQERLLALLEQAQSLEDILTLESRLSDIRYQLENMESSLRTYDNQIAYSTVRLNISEVVELTPVEEEDPGVWSRISKGFMESLEDIGTGLKEFFIGFVIVLPYLLLAAVIIGIFVGIIILIIKLSIASYKKRAAKKLEKAREEYQARLARASVQNQIVTATEIAQVENSATESAQTGDAK